MKVQFVYYGERPFGWYPKRDDGYLLAPKFPDEMYSDISIYDKPELWVWISRKDMWRGGYGWATEAEAKDAYEKWLKQHIPPPLKVVDGVALL